MPEDTITVGPNSEYAVNVKGRFFAVLGCTNPFDVEVDRGGKRTCSAGVKFSFEPFKRIVFYETLGQSNRITYYAGDAQYDGVVPRVGDAVPITTANGLPLQVVDAETFDYPYLMNVDGSLLVVGHTTGIDLPVQIVVDGVNRLRKSFHISNRTTEDLGIFKDTGECVDILQTNTDRTFYFSFDVHIVFLTSGNNRIALYYTLFNA